jgi:hypothetical protein
MDISEVKKGMYIIVSSTCRHTKEGFGWNNEMNRFTGTTQKISGMSGSRSAIRFDNCGYNWAVKDLMPATSEKEPNSFLFDVDSLDL